MHDCSNLEGFLRGSRVPLEVHRQRDGMNSRHIVTHRPHVPHGIRKATASLLIAALVATGCSQASSDAASGATVATTSASTSASSTASSTSAASELPSTTTAATSGDDTTTTVDTVVATTAAAEAFLATLSDEQREAVLYDFDDETKTTSWSNFPVTFVDRAGLNVNDLTSEQQAAALEVLAALLSDAGYATATGIMAGDAFLLENSPGAESSFGQYYIAFFGEPSESASWALQFGGHHLGINATMDGSDGSITFAPTHLGSQPAVFTDSSGTEVQPLAGMYEAAFAFYDSLTEAQRSALYQGEEVSDLSCAPGGTCSFPTGVGLAGADLTDAQKQLLLDVIANWVGMSDAETTASALAEIEATLDETYINWSGATVYDMTEGSGIHFQISGPNVYVEFSNQQSSAGSDVDGYLTSGWGHIHTIYRDPTSDYAGSATQQASSGPGGGSGGAPRR